MGKMYPTEHKDTLPWNHDYSFCKYPLIACENLKIKKTKGHLQKFAEKLL